MNLPDGDLPAPSPDDTRLSAIAEDFVARLRAGEDVEPESIAREHPELSEQLRRLLPTVRAMERCKRKLLNRSGRHAGLVGAGHELGEFVIEREIGRGGMGVVYAAQQVSLGRRVAIKVLSAAALPGAALSSREQIDRFDREAQTASQLNHPDIVPIHSRGVDAGVHYYVMPLIEGVGLDRVLWHLQLVNDALPRPPGDEVLDAVLVHLDAPIQAGTELDAYWKKLASIGARFADALDHAHRAGVWHRDVKPSNLLVEANGKVWITDFGIAKEAAVDDLTGTGEFIGTLHYAAPEQFDGITDPRGDVYGLGLTLLELAARTRVFAHENRRDFVDQIGNGCTRRLRQLDRKAPRDLETILAKATAFDPSHRYASAARLASDLRRFARDEPIEARVISAPERAWRWARRNRAIAGLMATAMLSIFAAAVIGWTALWSTQRALASERDAVARAEANLSLSLGSFDAVFASIAGDAARLAEADFVDAPLLPALPDKDVRLLQEVLAFYERFSAQNSGDERLRFETARAYRRAGDVHRFMGAIELAETAYRRAIVHAKLLPARRRNDEWHLEVASAHKNLAVVRAAVDGPRAALSHFESARRILETRVRENELRKRNTTRDRYELARLCLALGSAVSRGHLGAEARAPLAGRHMYFGRLMARRNIEHAVELATDLVNELDDARHRLLLGRSLRLLAQARLGADSTGSTTAVDGSVRQLERLSASFAGEPALRCELAEAKSLLAVLQRDDADSVQRAATAEEQARGLHAEYPGMPDYEELLARVLRRRAELCITRKQHGEARRLLVESASLRAALRRRFPWATIHAWELATVARARARVELASKQPRAARKVLEEALRSFDAKASTRSRQQRVLAAMAHDLRRDLAGVLEDLGEHGEAKKLRRAWPPALGLLRSMRERFRGAGR